MTSQTQGLKSTPLPRCFKADELLFPASPSLNTESFSVAEGSARVQGDRGCENAF